MDDSYSHTRSSSQDSPLTAITTPEVVSEEDDIWASDGSIDHSRMSGGPDPRNEVLSDLPSIKRQHMTDGYREGLSVGKAKVMQKGFDAGYPIGVEMALRAGKVIGSLEGVLAAKDIPDEKKVLVRKVLDQAKQELAITALLKDLSDEDVLSTTKTPVNAQSVLLRWEARVFGAASLE